MKRIVYPGTFDPIHNGHLDIAKKAAELFDELILVVAVNEEKTPLFSDGERVDLIKKSLSKVKNIRVDTFDGLIVENSLVMVITMTECCWKHIVGRLYCLLKMVYWHIQQIHSFLCT